VIVIVPPDSSYVKSPHVAAKADDVRDINPINNSIYIALLNNIYLPFNNIFLSSAKQGNGKKSASPVVKKNPTEANNFKQATTLPYLTGPEKL
jgi:hypothetical protein